MELSRLRQDRGQDQTELSRLRMDREQNQTMLSRLRMEIRELQQHQEGHMAVLSTLTEEVKELREEKDSHRRELASLSQKLKERDRVPPGLTGQLDSPRPQPLWEPQTEPPGPKRIPPPSNSPLVHRPALHPDPTPQPTGQLHPLSIQTDAAARHRHPHQLQWKVLK